MAATLVTGIEAVVFDLFGTLVYEFPRADWDGWLDTSAAILETDVDAFKAAWQATGIERQTGRLGDVEENLRTVAARAGAWPTDAQLTEILDARAEMYRKWFVPRPGAEEVLARLRAEGYRLGLISMCAPDAPAMWRASPLDNTVDVEVFSCDVGLRKPDPEIYLLATERLGVCAWGVPLRGRRLVPRALGRGGRGDAAGADPRPGGGGRDAPPRGRGVGAARRSTTSAGSRRCSRTRDAPTRRAASSAISRSCGVSGRSGGRTSGRIGTPRAMRISLSAAWNGIGPSSVRSCETCSPAVASRSCTSAATISGNAVARPETAPSAPCSSASSTSGSDPTNRSSPSSAYGSIALQGVSDTFRPARFGGGLAEALDHCHGDRVAGPARELVDVERQRSARLGRRAQVLEQRGFVEREVGRRDHGHRVGPDLLRVRRERDRVRGRLGSRVDRDLEAVGPSLDESFGDAYAFGRREQDPLAGRAADERAVDAALGEEAGEWTDGDLVQLGAPVLERRHRCGDRSTEHPRDAIEPWFPTPWSG